MWQLRLALTSIEEMRGYHRAEKTIDLYMSVHPLITIMDHCHWLLPWRYRYQNPYIHNQKVRSSSSIDVNDDGHEESVRRRIHSDDGVEGQDAIPTVFSWKHGGKSIYLSGGHHPIDIHLDQLMSALHFRCFRSSMFAGSCTVEVNMMRLCRMANVAVWPAPQTKHSCCLKHPRNYY